MARVVVDVVVVAAAYIFSKSDTNIKKMQKKK